MKLARNVVSQARQWLGCKESNGTHKAIIDVYNAHQPLARGYKVKYSDEWCATFVSAVAVKLGYTDIIPTECSCSKMIELFKKIGAWEENDARVPSPGDIIFYDWQDNSGKNDNRGSSDHVGIVEKVTGSFITVIEGNYSNAVRRRTLEVDGKYIRGYGVPKYDKESVKTVDELAKEVIDGKWGNGAERKARLAEAYGDNVAEAVQDRVNELLTPNIDKIAREVIAGKWGNGLARKRKLKAAGYDPAAVQKRVNELLK